MALLETTRITRTRSGAFNRFFDAIAAWNELRVTRNALARLTDRELADIGLTRFEAENIGC